ncbi:hypothetical protein GW17_00047787 [Ensete ventricosum]|nr:hypothetical protein GW17_00047787 [Ensete ventricosum]
MAEVRARAPGKIILSGEHAVVHGSTAVAAAIDLYTHVSFRLDPPLPPENGGGSVELELKDMALVFSWSSSRLKEVLGDGFADSSTPVSCSPERIKLIAALVEEQNMPEAKIWLSSGFRSGELTHIKSSSPLRMLITNTKVGRNTKALVAGVSERASRHPDAMASVFTAVDFISKEFSAIIQSPAQDDISITAREEKIEELMEMNQGLLQCMGVSHAAIEMVLRITLKYKLASKLTGAGGGGCVLTLMPTCMLLVLCHLIKS